MDNGIKAGQAGTVLKAGLSRLVKPTKEIQREMDKYGITLQKDADGNVELMGTVEHLRDKLGHLSKTQKAQALVTLFGQESLSGWASLINTSQDRVNELTKTIENSNGAASDMAEIMGDNLQGSIKELKSAFEGMMIIVGDMFIPIAKKVVDKVTDVIKKFNDLDGGAQKIIVSIGAAAAAIGPLLLGIGTIGTNIMKVMPMLTSLASGMGVTLTASTALTAGLAACGAGFVGLLAYMGSNSEMISYLQTEFGAFGTFLSGLGEVIYGVGQFTFGNLGILISTLGKMLVALVKGDFKECGNIWKDGWAKMEANTKEAVSNMAAETTGATAKMREMTSEQLQGVANDFEKYMGLTKQVTADNAEEMAKTFAKEVEGMSDETIQILRGSSDTFAVLFQGLTDGLTEQQRMNIFTNNLEAMTRSGAISLEGMEKDFKNFNKMIELNMSTGANQVSSSGEKLWTNFKDVSTRGIASVAESMAGDIAKMDNDTFTVLQGMGGTWGQVFDGITDKTNMSTEEIASTIEKNYKAMGMSSEEIMSAMEQDMNMYIASQKLANTTLSESNQKMVTDMTDIYNNLSNTTTDNVNAIADAVMDTVDGMAIGSVEQMRTMGEGFNSVFKGIKEDGSMNAEQTRAKVIENLQAMLEQGVPIGQLLKDDMTGFLTTMASEGEAVTGEFSANITSMLGNMPTDVGAEMSNLSPEVASALADTNAVATEGSAQVKEAIVNGLAGAGDEAKVNIDINDAVLTEVEEAKVAAGNSTQIKDAIVNGTAGVDTGVQANLSGVTEAVNTATSNAKTVADTNTKGVKDAISTNTAGINPIVAGNLGGLANIVSTNTANASKTAETNMSGMTKNVDNATKNTSKAVSKNLKDIEKNTKNNMSNASKSARQEATNMYNGVKTSFNAMQKAGTAATKTLKDNVINNTSILRNSAIRFWSEIRAEYSRSITGKIEITKTIKENKIVTTTYKTEGDKGSGASVSSALIDAFSLDVADIAIRQSVADSLSRIKSNDTIEVTEKARKGKTEERVIKEEDTKKGNTYITNNYTSPKAASLIELKKIAKRENRKLGVSFR